MKISVIIPAFNEADRLSSSLERVCEFLERREGQANEDFEVLVVDDGSADATARVAAKFVERGVRVLRLPTNRGKGAALKAGVLASQGDRVLLCDADLSTPIEDLARLESHMESAQIVIGSRALADADITLRQPFYREWMGKVFNAIIRLLGITGIRDTQCGFKLLDGRVARRLFGQLTIERFAFDVELIFLAQRQGYEVVEVGVTWANSPASRVDPLKDSFSMFSDVLRLRLRHRKAPPP